MSSTALQSESANIESIDAQLSQSPSRPSLSVHFSPTRRRSALLGRAGCWRRRPSPAAVSAASISRQTLSSPLRRLALSVRGAVDVGQSWIGGPSTSERVINHPSYKLHREYKRADENSAAYTTPLSASVEPTL